MDAEFVKYLASLGVGGILAIFIYMDAKKAAERHAEAIKLFADQWRGQAEQLMNVVKENTASNVRLVASLDSHQGLLYEIMKQLRIRRATDHLIKEE